MTMTHDELRKLAEAATPGDWFYSPWHIEEDSDAVRVGSTSGWVLCNTSGSADAAYIAAANPKKVLELLDRIAELEGALKPFAEAAGNFDRFPIKDATEWFAYGGESGRDAVRKGAISVADLRRAAELVKP